MSTSTDVKANHLLATGKTAKLLASSLAVAGLLQFACAPAQATVAASAELKAGTLGWVTTPTELKFPATTLNGLLQSISQTEALDVGDATGSGAGWNITATSTTFTNGPHTLATSATKIGSAPTVACDAGATGCVTATTTGLVSYPYSLPAGASAPTATRMFNAAANTGMGNQTVSAKWELEVPPSTFAGTYTSTWTLSLISAP